MANIYRESFTPVGAAGAGAALKMIGKPKGFVEQVVVNYVSQPSTTDIVLYIVEQGVTVPILTLTSQNTDGIWFPRHTGDGPTGVEIAESDDTATIKNHNKFYLSGKSALYISIAQGDPVSQGVKVAVTVSDD
jgi:hypothetical protein